ncbi:50S ribosomal protein L17 [Candidatus Fermentibacteria bacterium]|nr:50S ribosomal protein L17 [Candidatus Fermentibacteria bacterium]
MRHRKTTAKLSRNKAERQRMLRNMVTFLIMEERITTSLAKAKAARSVAERVITRGKKDTVHARRLVAKQVYGSEAVKKVFNELGPRYRERPGGYTRILKLGKRLGDTAEECILELVDSPVKVGSEKEE